MFFFLQGLCSELENRQFTLDNVNKKVESVLPDLTPKDREEMENSMKSLSSEHNRVYSVAVEQKHLLTEALNAREVFQVGLDRVNHWLEDREEKITKLEKHKLIAADVEKQMEKAKVSSKKQSTFVLQSVLIIWVSILNGNVTCKCHIG